MLAGKESRTVRILMVGSDPSVKGGITSVIGLILAHDWDREGIHIDFIPTYVEGSRLRRAVFFLSGRRRIARYLKNDPPDLVHIHMSYRGSYVRKHSIALLCQRASVPYLLHLHGSEFESWYETSDAKTRRGVRRLLENASAVIVLGERWRDAVRRIEPAANPVVIPNAVTIADDALENDGKSGAAQAAQGPDASGRAGKSEPVDAIRKWDRDSFQVLFLGVLIKRKGVADLLEAIRLLRDDGRIGRMRFVIAGSGSEEGHLRARTKEYDLEDKVVFCGWAEDDRKRMLLRESQALVLPSYHEGLPVAVLEAMAYGLPVIATDVGDTAFAVLDGKTGYLIRPGNPQQLADRLADLSSDREQYERMSAGARRRAAENFSKERMYRRLKECWRRILRDR